MKLNSEQLSLMEQWLEDESFIRWAMQNHPDDVKKWDDYFDRHPQNREVGAAARVLVTGLSAQGIPRNEERRRKALTRLLSTLESRSQRTSEPPKIAKTTSLYRRWISAAAVALLLLASGWWYVQFIRNPDVLLATEYGQTLEVMLPDSSRVVLNANSSLRYNKRQPREVRLRGEAFFKVKNKAETGENFQVFTDDLTVTVLGTAFNVNSHKDKTRVYLEEGKVNLKLKDAEKKTIEMKPGDLISYSQKLKKVLENRQDDSRENTSWKDGSLFFDDTLLPEALAKISEYYGIEFEIAAESVNERVLNGGVPIQNLDIALETLREAFDINITRQGNKYLIGQ